ncbi:hypothetical protein VNO77_22569 [Canavalia gladiata]|uniref:Uncharacterized protein n=1 Tax=Canavalia gladiata TaxID=3824 RepID=A0AAN9L5F6_CANGL
MRIRHSRTRARCYEWVARDLRAVMTLWLGSRATLYWDEVHYQPNGLLLMALLLLSTTFRGPLWTHFEGAKRKKLVKPYFPLTLRDIPHILLDLDLLTLHLQGANPHGVNVLLAPKGEDLQFGGLDLLLSQLVKSHDVDKGERSPEKLLVLPLTIPFNLFGSPRVNPQKKKIQPGCPYL